MAAQAPPHAVASSGPRRLQGALFQPIGDEGRAALVERRLDEAITGGHLRAGERLPSETDLAKSFGVAPVTVREALLSLRSRGLVVTRRGRGGGSFVAEDADPLAHARDAVRRATRTALRDMGVHYAAITGAAVRLAARRADPSEARLVARHLERLDPADIEAWRRILDDAQLELVALSQSARLTRVQMQLQAELSPYLRLIDADASARDAYRAGLERVVAAIEAGDDVGAGREVEEMTAAVIDTLIELRSRPAASADDAP
ncbi:GntR family transcriptional regulator [Microbacterium barkeri]|uniref:GntR family transcriptional regulator n=1 Tax=Microbacterium barkeri TaxID=33917 RepID=A0A9W6LX27_9MICO|nr:GntR family transcriptional regulator [Microbacterium barkeri]MDI6944396.1 GntR family transcriptional regulator [Microbacterium barkeri]MDR6877471.1 DNA-binding FadR family transcriptional regulator [Microbacterium barkeri]GLJ62409.1 GntR family transcriptional regulator [Microbacterium barkeri]